MFSVVSDIVREGYDKQNKTIEFVKSIIPPHYIKKIKDNFFIVSNINNNFNKLEPQGRIFLKGNRIRDIDYDMDLDQIILVSENIPIFLTIRKLNKY